MPQTERAECAADAGAYGKGERRVLHATQAQGHSVQARVRSLALGTWGEAVKVGYVGGRVAKCDVTHPAEWLRVFHV